MKKYTSDAFGNLIKVTESPDGITTWDTTYAYNPQNKLTQVNQGNGTQLRNYVYAAFGFLRSETLPEKLNQPVTYSTYDPLGNVITENQPGSLTITRSYDTAGRLTGVADPSVGQYLTNEYDGQVTCFGDPPDGCANGGAHGLGKLTRRIGYNPAGSPQSVVVENFFYDNAAGRLTSRDTRVRNGPSTYIIPTQTERWIYDLNGRPVQYDHPRSSGTFATAFAVATSYDHGYPVGIWANGLPTVFNTTYQPSGLLASYVTGNNTGQNVTTTIAQDSSSIPRPRQISTSGASQNFDTGIYSYDGAGNITAMGSDSFGYDRLSRLTSAALSGPGSQGYTYDQYANLMATTGFHAQSYSISSQSNRLTNATYDQRGNLQIIGSDTYTWDSVDRIARYQSSGGVDWHYLYSGAGERLVKIPPSGLSSDYVWTFRDEANRIATEYVGPTLSRDNVYLGNLLVASYASCAANGTPGWTYYSSDHLGTPRLITDASGTTVDLRKYWPYGEEASVIQPNSSVRLRLAGMERDTEGPGNRYYDHARSYEFQLVGRFLSTDLLDGDPSDPQSWNGYAYTLGNPLNLIDPLGLAPCTAGPGDDITCAISKDGFGFGGGTRSVLSGSFENGTFVASGDLTSEGVLSQAGVTSYYIGAGHAGFEEGFLASLPDFGGVSDFAAGFGASLTFGLTSRALDLTGANAVVDTGSGYYAAGGYVEVGGEFALLGLSGVLKGAAKGVIKSEVRRQARRAVRGLARSGEQVHHINPLFGHPGGASTLFPTGGLPAAIHSARWNLRVLSEAAHIAAHRQLLTLERRVRLLFNPLTSTARAVRNEVN